MDIAIIATKRIIKGKATSKLRKAGLLPAVLYGHKVETQDLELSEREFAKIFKLAGESTLVNLTVDGQSRPVLIHEVQNHYLTDKPIHVDFYAVNMDEKLKAHVPVHFLGEAPAVKSLGGVLVKNLSEIEVECLPADLPHAIEVDISILDNFEKAVYVRDLKVSDKVQIITSADDMVTNVAAPRSEAELASLSEKPMVEDVTQVEGLVKPEAAGEGEAEETNKKTD
jgi:large subunit ribosomal protein L25